MAMLLSFSNCFAVIVITFSVLWLCVGHVMVILQLFNGNLAGIMWLCPKLLGII